MVHLQQIHKVDMGHLCYTDGAAKRMTMSISETMKDRLKRHLKEENSPLSIILGEECYSKLMISLYWVVMKLGLLQISAELLTSFEIHYLYFKAYLLLRA